MADDFGSFATADTGSQGASNASFAAFGDFTVGSDASASAAPQPSSGLPNFGDFGGFGSSAGVVKTEGTSTNSFGDFDGFGNSDQNIPVVNGRELGQSEADFGDFSAFSTAPAMGVKVKDTRSFSAASVTGTSSRSGSTVGTFDAFGASSVNDSPVSAKDVVMTSRLDSGSESSKLDGDFGNFGDMMLTTAVPSASSPSMIEGLADSSSPDIEGANRVSAISHVICSGSAFSTVSGLGDFASVSNSAADDGDFGSFPGLSSQADSKPAVSTAGSAGFGDFGSLMSGGGSGGNSSTMSNSTPVANGSRTAPPPLSAKRDTSSVDVGDAFGDFGSVQSGAVLAVSSGLGSNTVETSLPGLKEVSTTSQPSHDFGDFGSFNSSSVEAAGVTPEIGEAGSSAALNTSELGGFNDFGSSSASSATNAGGFGGFDSAPMPVSRSIASGAVYSAASGSNKSSPASLHKVAGSGDAGTASFGSFSTTANTDSFAAFGGNSSPSPATGSQRKSDALKDDGAGFGSFPPADSSVEKTAGADDGFGGFGSFSASSEATSGTAFGAFGGQEKSEVSAAGTGTGDDFGDFGSFSTPSTAPAAAAAADDGFGSFGSAPAGGPATAAADDGFGSFGTAPAGGPAAAAAGGEADDFGDFGSFGSGSATPAAGDNAFGTFAAPAASTGFQAASSAAGDGDDFGGFGSFGAGTSNTASAFSSAPAAAPPAAAPAPVAPQPAAALKSFGSARETLKASFSVVSCPPLSPGRTVGLQSSLLGGGPWAELGRVGERPLASFDKMACRIRCDFLGALKVEASLIGVQSGQHQVPAFAAGLGLLQPSGSPALSHAPAVAPAVTGDDPFSMDTARQVSPLDLFGTSAAPTAYGFSSGERFPSQSSASGGSALLDLTLESSLVHSNAPAAAATVISDPLLQSDLMGLDLTFSSDVMSHEEAAPRAPSPVAPAKPKALSPEIERMIDSLPDLSFMLSRVLMFPAVLTSSA